MNAKSDMELLNEYVAGGSQAAFGEIAARHTDLVYAAACRQSSSPDLARDIAQSVFCDLARKAPAIVRQGHPSLAGWLYRSTRFASLNLMREEKRRLAHERQAMQRIESEPESQADWKRIEPILDEAMTALSTQDRDVLLLRFFKNLDFRSIGAALGLSDDTAQKRTARALEKLRMNLKQRGIASSAGALSAALLANGAQSAPAGLASALAGYALANAASAPLTVVGALKLMTISKLKIGALAALLVAGGGGYWVQHQALTGLDAENRALKLQIGQLAAQQEVLSNDILQAKKGALNDSNRLAELMKLRGEVSLLRRQNRDLELAKAAKRSGASGGITDNPAAPSAIAAPFQMQLVVDEPGEDTQSLTNISAGDKEETVHVQKTALMDYSSIRTATVSKDASGSSIIEVEFTPEGREQFAKVTKENINKRLAIVMDGRLYSAPMIRSEIPGGKAVVSGNFTEEEAQKLATKINEMLLGK
jgi:RNA polymerase sigma factor (sigma-70 family)